MWILGLSASHNGAAALLRDGKVEVAIQGERLSRIKRQDLYFHRSSPALRDCVRYCLEARGLTPADLDAVATTTPWQHVGFDFAGALGGRPADAASGIESFSVPHHLAHAEYALHYTTSRDAVVLVIDGSGTFEHTRRQLRVQDVEAEQAVRFVPGRGKEAISAYHYDGEAMRLVYRMAYPVGGDLRWASVRDHPSIGHVWEWASRYIFQDDSEAGKVMGLAGFGNAGAHAGVRLIELMPDGRVDVRFDRLQKLLMRPNTAGAAAESNPHYCALAALVQEETNRFLIELAEFLHDRVPVDDLCYAGGVALNGIANEHLIREGPFANVFQNGSCEDNGTAVGAALAAHHALTGERPREAVNDFYGRPYTDDEIAGALGRFGLDHQRLPEEALLAEAAGAIATGEVVGWFQGGSEFGPRALGHRNILADARSDAIKPVLDRKVKRREPYRPYAPAVIEEAAAEFFDITGVSPVMIRVGWAKDGRLPAVTHVDGTARVQTVSKAHDPRFHGLLSALGARTGVPVALSTSYNMAGEPIVETPEDALRTYMCSGMDALYIGNFVTRR
jgi:carbamoyltransferase